MATYTVYLYTPQRDEKHGTMVKGADGSVAIIDTRTLRNLSWDEADHVMVKHIDHGGLVDWECE